MNKRNNFKNIQIQGKNELAELFDDTYEQSGANSKGEFLSILLDEYLNPEEKTSKKVNEIEKEKDDLSEELNLISQEKADLSEELETISLEKTELEKEKNELSKKLHTVSLEKVEIEKEKNELSGELHSVSLEKMEIEDENVILNERLKHYENEFLKKIYANNNGATLKFRSTMTNKKMEIKINDLKDTYTAIIHSIQI